MVKTNYSKLYSYTVMDISEGNEIGFKAIIPKFPKLHILADSPSQLHDVVQIAIHEEIKMYKNKNKEIPKPDVYKCSGKFILRIRPEIHQMLTELSKAEGKTLNQYLNRLIESYVC